MCKYRECIYVHAPPVLEEEYLRTGEEEEEEEGARSVARACT